MAGTSGNTVTYYHCGDCGQVLNCTMLPVEKESIDRCLDNPDVYESSLKKYKAQYRNIEWEEPVSASVNIRMQISDIEEYIVEYVKNIGIPVKMGELQEKLRDKTENVFDVGHAIENLEKRGILKSEKENDYIPLYFTKALIRKLRTADIGSRTRIDPIVIENDRYRMKTLKEIESSNIVAEQNVSVEVLKEIATLKPIIEILQKAEKPLSCNELLERNEDVNQRSFLRVNSKLIQLEKAGVLKSKLLKKRSCYFIEDDLKDEIDKKLYEVVKSQKVRVSNSLSGRS